MIVAGWLLQACGDGDLLRTVVVSNDSFRLSGDSLVMGDTIIYSRDGYTIHSNVLDDNGEERSLVLSKDDKLLLGLHTDHQLINALSTMSAIIVADERNLQFETSNDLYDAIGMTLCYTDPALSMRLLKSRVKDMMLVGRDNDYYPAHNDRLNWLTAAWRVYQVTGDKEWMKFAYQVGVNTLESETDVMYNERNGLVRGSSSDDTPLTAMLPAWMSDNDVFSSYTLNNNIQTAYALRAMAEMASDMGNTELEETYDEWAKHLIEAINEQMWYESEGQYTAMLYGKLGSLHAPCSDNRAQALAVMWGIADDDDRGINIMMKTPTTLCGINTFYPARFHTTDPCLNEQSWGLTQGLWNLAAARVDNDNALRYGLAALWRAQALYSTLIVNKGTASLDVQCAISNMAMTYRIVCGMEFESGGIKFDPDIPSFFNGEKLLMGFKYRGATLDITVKGVGHDVDFILLDGKRIEGSFIAAEKFKGRHEIIITMKEGVHNPQKITIVTRNTVLPEEPIVTWNGDSSNIFNFNRSLAYKMVVDGKRMYSIDSTFAAPQTQGYCEIAVVAANNRCFSYTSRPYIWSGQKYHYISIPDSLAARDTINIDVNVAEAGTYLLNLNYISPRSACDVRAVTANTHQQGILVMAGLHSDSIASQSSIVLVDLLRDHNTIGITTHRASRNHATPLSINLFKK